MTAQQNQGERLIKLQVGSGPSPLQIKEFSGVEAISGLFNFSISVFSVGTMVALDQIIGQPATISVLATADKSRYINGYIRAASFIFFEESQLRYHYELTLVPWLWFLGQHTDCRIFQDMTSLAIIEKIFKEFGFDSYKFKTTKQPTTREYCVQYRESSLNFVQRLMEEDGLFYFFEHIDTKHILIIGDSVSVHEKAPVQDRFPARRLEAGDSQAAISGWREGVRLSSAGVALDDYNFKKASELLGVSVSSLKTMGVNKDLELYDYPGRYRERDHGETIAKHRMEYIESAFQRFYGDCNIPTLAPGYRITLEEHLVKKYNDTYIVLETVHEGKNNWGEQGGAFYQNQFEAMPANIVFRPERRARQPVIEGPQTAVVVGPSGEEIHVDEFGRIKVQFRWDRRGSGDERASCWIRVAQGWAGPRWGAVTLPRIGMEVLVAFLDGNPDRPLIVGCLYNSESMPPYALPAERSKTSFKTRSTPGGGNFNEVRFEDKKGKEQIFIHGAKDLDLRIKSERREFIGASSHSWIGRNHKEYVFQSKYLTVGGDLAKQVAGCVGWTIGQRFDCTVGQSYAVKVGQEIMLDAGMILTIKAGGAFIKLGPDGVTISGALVRINSGGSPGTLDADPARPKQPDIADNAAAGGALKAAPRRTLQRPKGERRQADALKRAARAGTPFTEPCK